MLELLAQVPTWLLWVSIGAIIGITISECHERLCEMRFKRYRDKHDAITLAELAARRARTRASDLEKIETAPEGAARSHLAK